MDESFNILTKKLSIIDIKKFNNIKYINCNNISIRDNAIIFYLNSKDGGTTEFEIEYAGVYYSETHIWSWAWALPDYECDDNSISNRIVNYALHVKAEPNTYNSFVKSFILTSQVNFKTEFQLNTYIDILLGLLNENAQFIFSNIVYLDKAKKKYKIDYYYIIKSK